MPVLLAQRRARPRSTRPAGIAPGCPVLPVALNCRRLVRTATRVGRRWPPAVTSRRQREAEGVGEPLGYRPAAHQLRVGAGGHDLGQVPPYRLGSQAQVGHRQCSAVARVLEELLETLQRGVRGATAEPRRRPVQGLVGQSSLEKLRISPGGATVCGHLGADRCCEAGQFVGRHVQRLASEDVLSRVAWH